VPEVALLPLQEPEAVHDVALVVVQARVELLPEVRVDGLGVMVMVGGGGAVTVTVVELGAEPPAPVQVSV
jgi:hypothetical protein